MENLLKLRYPTSEELYAYEREARRLRSAELARLFRAAGAAIASIFTVRRVGHA